MQRYQVFISLVIASVILAASCVFLAAGQNRGQQSEETAPESGQSVTGAYEGWYANPDGTSTMLIGYYNRNTKEILDIPIGPNNRVEPGGPDQGQPTHFLPRRQWGVFTIVVPADFGDKKLTWTIVANGRTTSVPMGLHSDYEVEPYKDAAMGNTPPILKLTPKGPALQGPPRGMASTLTTTLPAPLALAAWVTDEAHIEPGAPPTRSNQARSNQPPVSITWSLYRGPAQVTFDQAKP